MAKHLTLFVLALCAAGAALPSRGQEADPGWVSLFNGKDLTGWTKMGEGNWEVADGVLRYTGGGNGWLRSDQTFRDFQLVYEWRYTNPEGNHDSGLFLRAPRAADPWPSQFQMNMGPGDTLGSVNGAKGTRNRPDLVKAPGEWNTYEVILVGDRGLALINGQKAWDGFGFGTQAGHLGIQCEGPAFEVRTVRVRPLGVTAALAEPGPAADGAVSLFNGRDLTGWVVAGVEPEKSPFKVENGVIVCAGQPFAYLRTEKPYENYVLSVEWRYAHPERQQGRNSGLLLHIQGEDKVWPYCIEAQMMPGSAGELLQVSEAKMEGARRTKDTEKPLGEWNRYEVTCKDGTVTVRMNGEVVNQATGLEPRRGTIGLQSEGAEIHFRNISLRPL